VWFIDKDLLRDSIHLGCLTRASLISDRVSSWSLFLGLAAGLTLGFFLSSANMFINYIVNDQDGSLS